MKTKYILLCAFLVCIGKPLISQGTKNTANTCSPVSLEVGKYQNTVDEFYGAIKAVYEDEDVSKYPAYYQALGAAVQMDPNNNERYLYQTIESLWGNIQTAYNSESSKFTKLFKKSYERIESQYSSIQTKVKDFEKSGCDGNAQCECYIGQISPCPLMSSNDGCSASLVSQYYQSVNQFYASIQAALQGQSDISKYPKYEDALKAAVQMNTDQSERAMSNVLKSLWGDIDEAYKYYSKEDSKFSGSFGKSYKILESQMSAIDKLVDDWKSAGCKDDCSWNCYLGVTCTRCSTYCP